MRRHPCGIFRAGMQRRCLQSEPIERVFQKRYALLERIQKSHLQIRTQNEQRHARKARARTDVDDLCAVRKQPMRQRRGAVQIVTVYALILIQHSGQIHPCVVFIQNGMKRFKTLQCCFIRGNAHSVKTGL